MYGGEVQVVVNGTPSGSSITIHGGPTSLYTPHNQKTHLSWSNCICFGNGVESDTIRDAFAGASMQNGAKASTTLAEPFREERRKNGLIYSGIYNSTSGVNNLNQFIAGEKITKDLNPDYGSIQKLYTRDTDLLTLCEDRILNVLANKDALFNADGNVNLTATANVLGQATPISGEFGISTNPESFTSYASNVYFTDATRGAVMQLKGNSMLPISEEGMSDYFADSLKDATLWKCLGTYDEKKLDYNLTIEKRVDGIEHGTTSFDTLTFSDRSNGWVSFKSFYPEEGLSINNNYYTWKSGSMWQHHSNASYNNFYSAFTASSITAMFNDMPSIVKSFNLINYEGSQARVDQNLNSLDDEYYNLASDVDGWYCDSITTNKQEGEVLGFKEKEGKWYHSIHGTATTSSNMDESEFSVQGIGPARDQDVQSYSGTSSHTLTIQDLASNPLANCTVTTSTSTINSGTTLSGTKVLTITPDVGSTITHDTLTINGVDDSDGDVTDDDSAGTRTFGGTASDTVNSKFAGIVIAQDGTNLTVTFTLEGTMPAADTTINVDFD